MPQTTKTTKQRAASAKSTAARRKTATARRSTATPKASAPKVEPTAPQTPIDRARDAAEQAFRQVERAVTVQVGAVLEARDTVSGTVEDLQSRFGSPEAAEKEVKKFERRGTKARREVERTVKRNRKRIERELKTRRRKAEKRVTTERKRVEREAKTVVKRANGRADEAREAIRQIDLANGADFFQTQVGQVVEAGSKAARRAGERIAA
jgi:hypothetical protein